MPVDTAALADMSGVDQRVLTLFLKGTDGLSEDYIVDEVFSLKGVVDVLGTEGAMTRLRNMPPGTSHVEVLPFLVSEKDAFLERVASVPQGDHHSDGNKRADHEREHHQEKQHAHDRAKDAEKDKEKEKEGGFLKWIFKGKKKEHSHSIPASPPPLNEDAPRVDGGGELLPAAGGRSQQQPEPQSELQPEHHRDGSAHTIKHTAFASHDDDHKHSRSGKKSKKSMDLDEPTAQPIAADDSITRHIQQVEVQMSQQYNFGDERSTAEATPSVSRRQGATTDDDFQAIFNQFLSNN